MGNLAPTDTCEFCKYAAPLKNINKRECRLNPPVYVTIHNLFMWPILHKDEYCNQYRPV